MPCGIYRIINSKTGASYIGSSINIEKRLKSHANDLKNSSHCNIKLQADFNLYGKEVFEVEILQELEIVKGIRSILYNLEDQYIEQFKSKITGYNIADAKFGNVLQYHPDRENIIKRREQSRKIWLANLSDEEKQKRLENQYLGSANPNWKEHLNHNCLSCGKPLSHNGKHGKGYCNSCRDRTGHNNPFYGKKHTADTIAKLKARPVKTGKDNPLSKRIYADGLIFDTMRDCANHFGKSAGTITHRCKSKNYPNWYYL